MNHLRTAIAFTLAISCCSSANADLVFSDSEFDLASWTTTQTTGMGGQTFSQVLTGGNPDEYFRAETTTDNPVRYVHLNSSFVFDPSSGAITSIDFSIDIQNFFTFVQGMGFNLALKQSDSIFVGLQQTTSSAGTFQWKGFSELAMVESQFLLQTGTADLDFSTSGAPITFGFGTFNSEGMDITTGYDNYSVTISSVPEPSAFAFFALVAGATGATSKRRRRRAKADKNRK